MPRARDSEDFSPNVTRRNTTTRSPLWVSATSLKQSFTKTLKSNQPCFDVQRQGRAKFDFNSAVSSRRCAPYVMDSCGVRELHHYSLKSLRHVLYSTFPAPRFITKASTNGHGVNQNKGAFATSFKHFSRKPVSKPPATNSQGAAANSGNLK